MERIISEMSEYIKAIFPTFNQSQLHGMIATFLHFIGWQVGVPYQVRSLTERFIHFWNEKAEQSSEEPPFSTISKGSLPTAESAPTKAEKFEGFKWPGHVLFFGHTGTGKTTNFITMMLKGMFKEFDMFVFVGSDIVTEEWMLDIREAVEYNLQHFQSKPYENVFYFYKMSQSEEAIHFCTTQNKEKKKLIFFDDLQTNSKSTKDVFSFIIESKNANAQCIASLHTPHLGKAEQTIRENARYFVIYNAKEGSFNQLINQQKNNIIWKRIHMIYDIHDRVVVYDNIENKAYYGTHKMLRIDPLIDTNTENQKNAAVGSKQPTGADK